MVSSRLAETDRRDGVGSLLADETTALAAYRTMMRIRKFDEEAQRLFLRNLVPGSIHLSIGEEAIPAAFSHAMRETDYTFCTYRGHGHLISRGADLKAMFAELMGRAGGLCRGKGGSMHLAYRDGKAMGSYAIVGAHLPIALGAGLSAQIRGSDQVTVCFFGDGTTNIGAFHEALNLAAIWQLPVVYVCENNQYMEYTPIRAVTAVENPAAGRASAYGLPSEVVDGNDITAMCFAAAAAVEAARQGRGPVLLEAVTYRHGGHSRADPGKYRPAAEVQAWMERDPITRYRDALVSRGIQRARLEAIDAAVDEEIAAAARAAEAEPDASEGELLSDLWADGSAQWRR